MFLMFYSTIRPQSIYFLIKKNVDKLKVGRKTPRVTTEKCKCCVFIGWEQKTNVAVCRAHTFNQHHILVQLLFV